MVSEAGPEAYQTGFPEPSYIYAAMNAVLSCTSTEYPRPGSAGFHHQPVCGCVAVGGEVKPLAAKAKRVIGIVPPGQVSVPSVASANVIEMLAGDAPGVGAW